MQGESDALAAAARQIGAAQESLREVLGPNQDCGADRAQQDEVDHQPHVFGHEAVDDRYYGGGYESESDYRVCADVPGRTLHHFPLLKSIRVLVPEETLGAVGSLRLEDPCRLPGALDRKSTRLNSSHVASSYAVFCLKKKKGVVHRERRKHAR